MRPIDADALLKGKEDHEMISTHLIFNAPTLDVKPVIKGKWFDQGSMSCRCSKCGCKNIKESPYCPWCGADMRESEDTE